MPAWSEIKPNQVENEFSQTVPSVLPHSSYKSGRIERKKRLRVANAIDDILVDEFEPEEPQDTRPSLKNAIECIMEQEGAWYASSKEK